MACIAYAHRLGDVKGGDGRLFGAAAPAEDSPTVPTVMTPICEREADTAAHAGIGERVLDPVIDILALAIR